MHRVGFEPTIPVLERAKTVDRHDTLLPLKKQSHVKWYQEKEALFGNLAHLYLPAGVARQLS
jgi:hypothetical protein